MVTEEKYVDSLQDSIIQNTKYFTEMLIFFYFILVFTDVNLEGCVETDHDLSDPDPCI